MKQKNTATVNPFIARPATYYGDGPFDPPSSDDDEEEVDSGRHSSEANAESVLLLNANKSGPSSPGRAERGDQSPHRTDAIEKVRLVFVVAFWKRLFLIGVCIDYRRLLQSAFLLSYSFLW